MNMVCKILARLGGAVAVLALVSCGQKQVFQVKGVVEEVRAADKKLKVAHEKIPGYMEAMTMVFDVKSTNELAALQRGDSIAFRMVVTDKDGWIEQIQKLASGTPIVGAAPDSFRRVREVDPLNVGDLLPDYRFTNELGQAVSVGDFKGRAFALTFIFTRCPFPTYCPRMVSNLGEAAKKLKSMPNALTNWHLLSLSIDPAYDTPAVLKTYAERLDYDPKRWSFVTGDLIDVTAIAEQFGLLFWRPDPNQVAGISHNLRTVVIDAGGRVQKVFKENEWKVDDLVAEIAKAAAVR